MDNKKCRIYAACGVSQTPIEKKNEGIRNFLMGTVVFGTLLGVLGNYISDFLF